MSHSERAEESAEDRSFKRAFAARLRGLRGRTSQEDAAAKAKIPLSTWRSYEGARHSPSLENSVKICTAFGADLHWLATGAAPKGPALTKEEAEVLHGIAGSMAGKVATVKEAGGEVDSYAVGGVVVDAYRAALDAMEAGRQAGGARPYVTSSVVVKLVEDAARRHTWHAFNSGRP